MKGGFEEGEVLCYAIFLLSERQLESLMILEAADDRDAMPSKVSLMSPSRSILPAKMYERGHKPDYESVLVV